MISKKKRRARFCPPFDCYLPPELQNSKPLPSRYWQVVPLAKSKQSELNGVWTWTI